MSYLYHSAPLNASTCSKWGRRGVEWRRFPHGPSSTNSTHNSCSVILSAGRRGEGPQATFVAGVKGDRVEASAVAFCDLRIGGDPTNSPQFVILREAGRSVGDRRSRRICSCFSGQHPISGTFEIRRFKTVPILAHVDPSRIGLFDERGFLFAAPAFQLLFARNRLCNILITLEPHKAIAVVLLCESIMLFPFVFKHALEQIAGHPDVDGAASARHDVGEVTSLVHNGNVSRILRSVL